MARSRKRTALFFEAAWEVCNQVGGIYTVIRTKAPAMISRRGAGYFLIGPYIPATAPFEFEESGAPAPVRETIEELSERGAGIHFGRWLVEGRPNVILLEVQKRLGSLDRDKYFFWKDHQISTINADDEVNQALAFGLCIAEFFAALCPRLEQTPVVAHFHEWLSAAAILKIKRLRLPVATIFTTHATLLGRYIAGDNRNLYAELKTIDPQQTAAHYNIESRFLLERAGAQSADFCTTVSDVTAVEVERFLGRKPDAILPNGLNLKRYVALHEFQNLHAKYKNAIHEFVMGHFFPSYSFDLERTLYFFISGRYEYRNKGMDVFIEALYRLNNRLKQMSDPPTIVVFVITRAETHSMNVGALQAHSMFEDLRRICSELERSISRTILSAVARGEFPSYDELLSSEFRLRLRRTMHARRTTSLPGIATHDLADDAGDPVLRHLRHRQLFNGHLDPVKIIFHPDFMSETNPLFNLDYANFVRGCHLGVFPSYYEPWGYTPAECLALGVPTVTTDLSGFGTYARNRVPRAIRNGIFVLRRSVRSIDDVIEDLASYLFEFARSTRRERIELRNRAERCSTHFGWTKLAAKYHEVHRKAVEHWQAAHAGE